MSEPPAVGQGVSGRSPDQAFEQSEKHGLLLAKMRHDTPGALWGGG